MILAWVGAFCALWAVALAGAATATTQSPYIVDKVLMKRGELLMKMALIGTLPQKFGTMFVVRAQSLSNSSVLKRHTI